MKTRSCIFLSAVALALAFLIGATAALNAMRAAPELSGEVLCGERSAAAGVAVSEDMTFAGHLVWDLDWDSGSGTGSHGSRWTLAECQPPPEPDVPELRAGVSAPFASYAGPRMVDSFTGIPALDAILDDLRSGHEGEGELSGEFLLNDYTDGVFLSLAGDNLFETSDGSRDFNVISLPSGRFAAALREPVPIRVTYTNSGGAETASFEPAGEDSYTYAEYEVSSAFVPGGWFYFLVYARDSETGELLEPLDAPGGGWSVCRIPVTDLIGYELTTYNGQTVWTNSDDDVLSRPGRWWAESSYAVEADSDALEAVYTPGGDWEAAWITCSYDGEGVLLFTVEDGVIRLRVLDAATGALVQTLPLFPEEETDGYGIVSMYSDAGRAVFAYECNGAATLLPARIEDRRFVPGEAIEFSTSELVPGSTGGALIGCAWDGERLAALELLSPRADAGEALLLCVYSDGEPAFAELFDGEQIGYYMYHQQDFGLTLDGASLTELCFRYI